MSFFSSSLFSRNQEIKVEARKVVDKGQKAGIKMKELAMEYRKVDEPLDSMVNKNKGNILREKKLL
jgi:hypothetical protein